MGYTRSDVFPSKYLNKKDVENPIVVTMDDFTIETLIGEHGDEKKGVLYFVGDVKPLIVNSGNWEVIESIYGDNTDGWLGHKIEIYNDPSVRFGRKVVGGIRIRQPNKQTNDDLQWMTTRPVLVEAIRVGDKDAWRVTTESGQTMGTFDVAHATELKLLAESKSDKLVDLGYLTNGAKLTIKKIVVGQVNTVVKQNEIGTVVEPEEVAW